MATAKKTRCDDFITALPDGYNTVIGEASPLQFTERKTKAN
ncbi:hypothetical protein [Gemmiger sp.]